MALNCCNFIFEFVLKQKKFFSFLFYFLGVPSPELPELVTTKTNVYTKQQHNNNNKIKILNNTIIQTEPEQITAD